MDDYLLELGYDVNLLCKDNNKSFDSLIKKIIPPSIILVLGVSDSVSKTACFLRDFLKTSPNSTIIVEDALYLHEEINGYDGLSFKFVSLSVLKNFDPQYLDVKASLRFISLCLKAKKVLLIVAPYDSLEEFEKKCPTILLSNLLPYTMECL